MTGPIDGWRADHAKFERVLDVLDRELLRFQAERTPDYAAMLDVVSYLRGYGDAFHHPKEDVAFKHLLAHDPSLELPIARLLQEHRVIAAAGDTLSQLLQGVVGGGEIIERSIVETAAATYLTYYRHHMAVEEQFVIPRAAELLTAADWDAVAAATQKGTPARTAKEHEAPYRDLLERCKPSEPTRPEPGRARH